MYPGKKQGSYKGKSNVVHKLRKNDRIRVPEVRVIGPDGTQIGVMKTRDAITKARSLGLDLLEISPTTKPPVCRIVDSGKYTYEESKKQKGQKSSVAATKLKEVKFRVTIDQHDYETKVRQAEGFLYRGNKLKVTLMFRGRELTHKELGFNVVTRAIEDLKEVASVDHEPKLAGRNINVTLTPLPQKKRKLKFNNVAEAQTEAEPDSSQKEESDGGDDPIIRSAF